MNKLSKRRVALITLAMMAMMATGCAQNKPADNAKNDSESVELLVSAAASLTPTLETIATQYQQVAPEVTLVFSFGGSGALQSQIEEGAPADIFISAAQKQMDGLDEKALLAEDTRQDLLLNQVVLIVPKDSPLTISDFADLGDDQIKKVGLGEPQAVPVGQYAEEILGYLNLLETVTPKAVYGSDVRQVLTWVESGEVDCGVVYATDAASSDLVKVVVTAPEDSHQPVIYPVAVIKDSQHQEQAQAFSHYLASEEAMKVFEAAGFKKVGE